MVLLQWKESMNSHSWHARYSQGRTRFHVPERERQMQMTETPIQHTKHHLPGCTVGICFVKLSHEQRENKGISLHENCFRSKWRTPLWLMQLQAISSDIMALMRMEAHFSSKIRTHSFNSRAMDQLLNGGKTQRIQNRTESSVTLVCKMFQNITKLFHLVSVERNFVFSSNVVLVLNVNHV